MRSANKIGVEINVYATQAFIPQSHRAQISELKPEGFRENLMAGTEAMRMIRIRER